MSSSETWPVDLLVFLARETTDSHAHSSAKQPRGGFYVPPPSRYRPGNYAGKYLHALRVQVQATYNIQANIGVLLVRGPDMLRFENRLAPRDKAPIIIRLEMSTRYNRLHKLTYA